MGKSWVKNLGGRGSGEMMGKTKDYSYSLNEINYETHDSSIANPKRMVSLVPFGSLDPTA